MADALIAVERNMGSANRLDAWPRAKTAAARALELDPMLSEAHAAMAAIRAREYGWEDAERGFRRAIELDPNNALAHLELGVRVLVAQGRFEAGLEEVQRALALDPLSPYVHTEAGEALLLAGRYDEAAARFRRAIALDPSRNRPFHSLARVLSLQNRFEEARDAHARSIRLGAPPAADPWAGCREARAGRPDAALALLQAQHLSSARFAARTYACLGDEAQSLDYLERAVADNEPGLAELLQAPELASIRGNPRFLALRKTLNLPR
jgi:Tfp pilus assembly protein PilF